MDNAVHFDIPADNMKRAEKFYHSVFGRKITDVSGQGMEYMMAETGPPDSKGRLLDKGAINGGIMKRDATGKHPSIVIMVDSMDSYLDKVTKLAARSYKNIRGYFVPEIPGISLYPSLKPREISRISRAPGIQRNSSVAGAFSLLAGSRVPQKLLFLGPKNP